MPENRRRPPSSDRSLAAVIALSSCILPALCDSGRAQDAPTVTTLVDNGDPRDMIDIVFLGDGFTAEEQERFNDAVDRSVDELLGRHPLSALRTAFNIHRVNVVSAESGTDIPAACADLPDGVDPVDVDTAMDTTFCSGGSTFRCLGTSDLEAVLGFVSLAPGNDQTVVLVNTTRSGGCASPSRNLSFISLGSDYAKTLVHEMGHALGDVDDEYTEFDRAWTDGEPGDPNLTVATTLETLEAAGKWSDLVLPETPLPTVLDGVRPDGSATPETGATEPLDADVVGTFEGAERTRWDIFRPEQTCTLRSKTQPFCAVCRRELLRMICSRPLPWFLASRDRPQVAPPGIPRDGLPRFPGRAVLTSLVLDDLLVRDTHDGGLNGRGDIFLEYEWAGPRETLEGRWPSDGVSKLEDGDSTALNAHAGSMSVAPGEATRLALRVRDRDDTSRDDTLADDADMELPSEGEFTIDRADYMLRGHVRRNDLLFLLDTLTVKRGFDASPANRSDIALLYTITCGGATLEGRWPSSGTRNFNHAAGHRTEQVEVEAGTIPSPGQGESITLRLRLVEKDYFLFWGWETVVQDDTFTLDEASGFDLDAIAHILDTPDFRLTISVTPLR